MISTFKTAGFAVFLLALLLFVPSVFSVVGLAFTAF